MGKTNRYKSDGEFKKLKASKKPRNKKQRAARAKLQKQLQFAAQHRANRNMTQFSAAMYMNTSTEADFDPSTFSLGIDPATNESAEFIEAVLKKEVDGRAQAI